MHPHRGAGRALPSHCLLPRFSGPSFPGTSHSQRTLVRRQGHVTSGCFKVLRVAAYSTAQSAYQPRPSMSARQQPLEAVPARCLTPKHPAPRWLPSKHISLAPSQGQAPSSWPIMQPGIPTRKVSAPLPLRDSLIRAQRKCKHQENTIFIFDWVLIIIHAGRFCFPCLGILTAV